MAINNTTGMPINNKTKTSSSAKLNNTKTALRAAVESYYSLLRVQGAG
jgi:hypothetical protein